LRRRFATGVLNQNKKIASTKRSRFIILAASARVRRYLYPVLDTLSRQEYRIHKLSKNIINFSPHKIHGYLAENGLIPEQKKSVSGSILGTACQKANYQKSYRL
jgi:hypothetical protein